jgi:hypothetical protein
VDALRVRITKNFTILQNMSGFRLKEFLQCMNNIFSINCQQGLFRNHGDKHLPLLKPHIEKLILEKNETSQRCAAEFIAGKCFSLQKIRKRTF